MWRVVKLLNFKKFNSIKSADPERPESKQNKIIVQTICSPGNGTALSNSNSNKSEYPARPESKQIKLLFRQSSESTQSGKKQLSNLNQI